MAFEDLSENLKNQIQQLGERITNSALYSSVREHYENLGAFQQKIAKVFVFSIVLTSIVLIPTEYFLASIDHESEFEIQRKLIKDIIRSERELTALPDLPRPLPAESVKSNVESQLKEMNFLPEQIKQVSINYQPTSTIIPSNKLQYGIDVTINKINVKQLTNLGSKLQIIHPAVKLKDLIITLNREDARYLNADIKLVALNIPEYKVPEPPPEPPKKRGKKSTKTDEE